MNLTLSATRESEPFLVATSWELHSSLSPLESGHVSQEVAANWRIPPRPPHAWWLSLAKFSWSSRTGYSHCTIREDLDRGGISDVETWGAPGRERERRRKGRGEGERNLSNTGSLINIKFLHKSKFLAKSIHSNNHLSNSPHIVLMPSLNC